MSRTCCDKILTTLEKLDSHVAVETPTVKPALSSKYIVGKAASYFDNHFKTGTKFVRVFSCKITSGSFDERNFTIVISASRKSSLILLVVELTKEQIGCTSSLSRKQVNAGILLLWKITQRFDERHTELRKTVAGFALNNINDFKVRYFQSQTLTFTVNSDVFCYDVLSESRWKWIFALVWMMR